jgi:hypothetical protein
MSAGVGGPWGWEDVTIYMKRIRKLLLEASRGHQACGTVSLPRSTNEPVADRHAL